jgi:transcriptional regulator with XRE-family HTH domain
VEAVSAQEFKASVLGAYERGERVISVPRLQRLAGLYNVPVDQLLPEADDVPPTNSANEGAEQSSEQSSARPRTVSRPHSEMVTFDLTRFVDVDDRELGMLYRYLTSIVVQRQDFNGRVLTIRGDDIRAIAGLFGVEPGELVRRLDDLQLRVARSFLAESVG